MSAVMDGPRIGKRERRKSERREAILDLAQRSFLELGYDRTTMSRIAETMGGSKGTLWTYFSSKEALFEAVIDRACTSFRKELMIALDPKGRPETGLLRFAEGFIRKITSDEAIALHRIVVGESPRFPELGRIFFSRAPGAMLDLLASYMADQMEAGGLRNADPSKAAAMFLSLCDGGHHKRVLWGVETYSADMAKREAADAVEHFLLAYGP